MKKIIFAIIVILLISLIGCNNTDTPDVIDTPEEKIATMEMLTSVNEVISVTEQSFESDVQGAIAYKVILETSNGKLAADVVLPIDYADKNYNVLIYFPDVKTFVDTLAKNYALNDIIVIRPYARGTNESEGLRDFGGNKDLSDAQELLNIFDCASFIENSKIFVAGSSDWSITALRLIAEDKEHRISGCAIVDSITDLHSYSIERGEFAQNLMSALIGKTYEEAPEEYEMRSAVNFSEKLDRPILILHYANSPLSPINQAEDLYELIKDKTDCTYHKMQILSSDFLGEAHRRLLSWINKHD